VISEGADRIFSSRLATPAQWRRAERVALDMVDAWNTFRAGDVPPRLVKPTSKALDELVAQIATRDRSKARAASIDASYASINLQLRYRPVTEVDTVRFELWTRRALVHAIDGSLGGVRSDLVTMEWIRDRIVHTVDPVTRTRIDTLVRDLGTAVIDHDLGAAADVMRALREVMAGLI
jgi:hypothetical protein